MMTHDEEIQKLLVEIFDLTGYKMTADDPTIIMMMIQRREMANLIQQHQSQQQFFLDKLTQKAEAIIASADTFEGQKQTVIQEILKTNTEELALLEAKLFAQTSKRIEAQFNQLVADLMKSVETRAFRFLIIMLIIQVGVLIASLIL